MIGKRGRKIWNTYKEDVLEKKVKDKIDKYYSRRVEKQKIH